ncbi:MAG: hypothetical protein FWC47_04430 [Oscillospiraceae bacterium]|nr:hypothetical protein [Oscillospiraceae bacterium]
MYIDIFDEISDVYEDKNKNKNTRNKKSPMDKSFKNLNINFENNSDEYSPSEDAIKYFDFNDNY